MDVNACGLKVNSYINKSEPYNTAPVSKGTEDSPQVKSQNTDTFVKSAEYAANADSKYNNLTEAQIKYLKDKYDVTNVSGKQWNDLLSELSEMGVIGKKDMLVASEFVYTPADIARKFREEGILVNEPDWRDKLIRSEQNDLLSVLKERLQKVESNNHPFLNPNRANSLRHVLSVLQMLIR